MSLVTTARVLAKKAILSSKALRLGNKHCSRSIVILKYHSVQERPEEFDASIGLSIVHPLGEFRKQMEVIARDYNPVTIDDILLFLRGEKELPKCAVAITFDDGYLDNFEIAAPVLDRFGIRATFYVTVGTIEPALPPWFVRLRHAIWTTKKKEVAYLGNGSVLKIHDRNDRLAAMRVSSKMCANLVRDSQEKAIKHIEDSLDVEPFIPRNSLMMNWDQIRKLHESGHLIGSHTIDHPNVAHLRQEDLNWELTESKRVLDKELLAPVIHFSYPNPALTPQFNEQTTAAARKSGYETAVISSNGPVCNGDDPMLLERLSTPIQKEEFLWNLECTLLGRRV